MSDLTNRVLEELVSLNAAAEVKRTAASTNLAAGRAEPAIALALLAIERRLAMLSLFVVAAMEEEDEEEEEEAK